DCHGTAYLLSVSQGLSRSVSSRLAATLGNLSLSSGCTQPSRTSRAAIQSVNTMMSRSIGWPADSLIAHPAEELVAVVDVLLVRHRDPAALAAQPAGRAQRTALLPDGQVTPPVGQ